MIKTITTIFFICIHLVALGQESDVKKKINKIKKSSSYISAEATLSSKEDAYTLANNILVSEINNWIGDEGKINKLFRNKETGKIKQIVIEDINTCYETLEMKRGNNIRAFVYVKKDQIIPIYGDGHIIIDNNNNNGEIQSLVDLSKQTVPKNLDTTAIEEELKFQKIEKRKVIPAEDPLPVEPKLESKPEQQASVSEEEAQATMDAITSKRVEIISAIKKQNVVNCETTSSIQPQVETQIETQIYSRSDALESIVMAGNIKKLKPIFSDLKDKNKIQYGKLINPKHINPQAYMLLFNKFSEILAIIEPGKITPRKDLMSLEYVIPNNYKGCGAYWFILD